VTATRPVTSDELVQVVHLLSDANSAALHARHVAALQRVCALGGGGGIAVRDVPKVQQILDVAFQLTRERPDLVEPVCQLIKCLGRPFVRRSATDELAYFSTVSALLACLCQLFSGGFHVRLQLHTAEVRGADGGAAGVLGARHHKMLDASSYPAAAAAAAPPPPPGAPHNLPRATRWNAGTHPLAGAVSAQLGVQQSTIRVGAGEARPGS